VVSDALRGLAGPAARGSSPFPCEVVLAAGVAAAANPWRKRIEVTPRRSRNGMDPLPTNPVCDGIREIIGRLAG
jgi:hypothetical protein